jgi:hypothetical protein
VAGLGLSESKSIGFLQKPYRPPVLAKVVRECLDAA